MIQILTFKAFDISFSSFSVIHDTASMREKEVTIRITKVLDESAYVAPIVSALITMGILIVISYLVVGFKS